MAGNTKTYDQLDAAASVEQEALLAVANPNTTELQKANVRQLAAPLADILNEGALSELVYATSQGKNAIATALTEKGIPATSTETLISMADKISGADISGEYDKVVGRMSVSLAGKSISGFHYKHFSSTGDCILWQSNNIYWLPNGVDFADINDVFSKAQVAETSVPSFKHSTSLYYGPIMSADRNRIYAWCETRFITYLRQNNTLVKESDITYATPGANLVERAFLKLDPVNHPDIYLLVYRGGTSGDFTVSIVDMNAQTVLATRAATNPGNLLDLKAVNNTIWILGINGIIKLPYTLSEDGASAAIDSYTYSLHPSGSSTDNVAQFIYFPELDENNLFFFLKRTQRYLYDIKDGYNINYCSPAAPCIAALYSTQNLGIIYKNYQITYGIYSVSSVPEAASQYSQYGSKFAIFTNSISVDYDNEIEEISVSSPLHDTIRLSENTPQRTVIMTLGWTSADPGSTYIYHGNPVGKSFFGSNATQFPGLATTSNVDTGIESQDNKLFGYVRKANNKDIAYTLMTYPVARAAEGDFDLTTAITPAVPDDEGGDTPGTVYNWILNLDGNEINLYSKKMPEYTGDSWSTTSVSDAAQLFTNTACTEAYTQTFPTGTWYAYAACFKTNASAPTQYQIRGLKDNTGDDISAAINGNLRLS